ncbi:L-asparaginase [Burkholderiales bacterium]|nr:L-asparaginase [Burkholderiales bacterium]
MAVSGAWPHVPLAAVERGGRVESVHAGSVAVVDADGTLVAAAGSPDFVAFTRSALKPLQALPFVAAGGPARFGLVAEQVALLCASHSGEAKHQAAVADMLAKAGCSVGELGCGTHAPLVYEALGEPPPPPPYSPLAHNCSGKHAGMLACCVLHGWPREGYLDPTHPLQATIRTSIARHAGTDEDALAPAIDGCSAPNYALPLTALARAYARVARPDDGGDDAPARRMVADAMTAHPDYVSGERRSDLALMRAGRGDWIAKVGAEGVQAIGLRRAGLGIAIKLADGSARAVAPVAVAILESLGVLDAAARSELAAWAAPVLHNARGAVVGAIRSVVVLDKGRAGRSGVLRSAGK